MHSFIKDLVFVPAPLPSTIAAQGWGKPLTVTPPVVVAPVIEDEAAKKQLFGIELAKADNPFEAACKVFPETKTALWVAQNWTNDPAVVASKDLYLKNTELNQPILDKEQLAAMVLREAQLTPEGKDRVSAYKLYSEIAGYTGKIDIDASTKHFTHNEMTIKLVTANHKKETEIKDITPLDEEIVEPSPIKLKLVKAS